MNKVNLCLGFGWLALGLLSQPGWAPAQYKLAFARSHPYKGCSKNKELDSELADWLFPLYWVPGFTRKNFSSLAYSHWIPIYTKAKENYESHLLQNFKLVNLFKIYLMASVRIPEVLIHLLIPIFPYLAMRNLGCVIYVKLPFLTHMPSDTYHL